MSQLIMRVACTALLLLGSAATAVASNPVKWQISVGPEAVLTARSGGRVPFSATSNPSPVLHPTELFPEAPPATQNEYVLRGEVRVYFAVLGFAAGGTGTETTAYEVTLKELKLERVEAGKSSLWRIPKAEYADLLKHLERSGAPKPEK
jgi:hypothetical protein